MRHPPLPTSTAELAPLDAAFWQVVDAGAAALSVELSRGVRAAIDAHVRLLLAWNAAINLTSLRTPEAIARGHVLDSLAAIAVCRRVLERAHRAAQDVTMLDLGSGGGYPGMALALVLGVRRAALVDSVQKKARFLHVAADAATQALEAAGERAPQVIAIARRSEDLAADSDHRQHWDLVIARAVGSLAEVVELGLPLAAIGGSVIAWKRTTADDPLEAEIGAARRIVQAAGGSRPVIEQADPGGLLGLPGHVLVVVEKVRPTPDRYPRSPAERKRAALLG